MEIISLLQSLYTQFDVLCGDLDIYKVSYSIVLVLTCEKTLTVHRWRRSVTLIARLEVCIVPVLLTHNRLHGWLFPCWKLVVSIKLTTDNPSRLMDLISISILDYLI